MLQNLKQISKPSAQQKTITFEQFEAQLTLITTPINKQADLLEISKSHATIQKSSYKADKHWDNQRPQQENWQKIQIQLIQTQKSPQII